MSSKAGAGNKDDTVNESNDKFQVSKENLSLNFKKVAPIETVTEHLQLELDQPHLVFMHENAGSAPYEPASTTSKTVETTLSRPVARASLPA